MSTRTTCSCVLADARECFHFRHRDPLGLVSASDGTCDCPCHRCSLCTEPLQPDEAVICSPCSQWLDVLDEVTA